MRLSFRGLATFTSLLLFGLAAVWLLAPNLLLSDWGVAFNASAGLVGRRAAALYAGLAVMLLAARKVEPSAARSAISKGLVATLLSLAALGVYELQAGHATPKILLAVVIEVALTMGFLFVGRVQPLRSDAGRTRKNA